MILALAVAAFAYETDQLTDRELPLADAAPPCNAKVDELLDVAIRKTNRRIGPNTPDDRVRKVLARRIHRAFTGGARVHGRGFFRGLGYSVYSAWMEEADIPRQEFPDRDDIYGDSRMRDSTILHLVGPSSTFNLAGVRMGSDKPDHFFDLGFDYLVWSRWGLEPERAVRKGTFTENSYYGLLTSKTFSYADLEANHDGFLFYSDLLAAGSVVARAPGGRVVRTADWDWADWVSPAWDEVQNPSVYTSRVQAVVTTHLTTRADQYCATWRAAPYTQSLGASKAWHAKTAPPRSDPFRLAELCP